MHLALRDQISVCHGLAAPIERSAEVEPSEGPSLQEKHYGAVAKTSLLLACVFPGRLAVLGATVNTEHGRTWKLTCGKYFGLLALSFS